MANCRRRKKKVVKSPVVESEMQGKVHTPTPSTSITISSSTCKKSASSKSLACPAANLPACATASTSISLSLRSGRLLLLGCAKERCGGRLGGGDSESGETGMSSSPETRAGIEKRKLLPRAPNAPAARDDCTSLSSLHTLFAPLRCMSVPYPLSWLEKGCEKECAGSANAPVPPNSGCVVGCSAYPPILFSPQKGSSSRWCCSVEARVSTGMCSVSSDESR